MARKARMLPRTDDWAALLQQLRLANPEWVLQKQELAMQSSENHPGASANVLLFWPMNNFLLVIQDIKNACGHISGTCVKRIVHRILRGKRTYNGTSVTANSKGSGWVRKNTLLDCRAVTDKFLNLWTSIFKNISMLPFWVANSTSRQRFGWHCGSGRKQCVLSFCSSQLVVKDINLLIT